jgi:hydroxyethylthiazole kinase-like uncharacterized protein yjeF
VAESVAPAMAATFPEAGVLPLVEAPGGSVNGTSAAERVHDAVSSADAVLVGPGLDDIDETADLLTALLRYLDRDAALVLDAYGLGALAQTRDIGEIVAGRESSTVLTPNSQELKVLLQRDTEPDGTWVREAAHRYSCCVSSQATVASYDGRAWRIPQGHAGLATAGSGDVLAGLVLGLLGRGADAEQAACWATYLHATAGERLSSAVGGVGFLARELVDQVPRILAELT